MASFPSIWLEGARGAYLLNSSHRGPVWRGSTYSRPTVERSRASPLPSLVLGAIGFSVHLEGKEEGVGEEEAPVSHQK